MAYYKGDSDDDINDDNEKANYLNDNDKDSTQYIIATHLSNKSFMHFLITKDFFSLSEPSETKYFVLNCYTKPIF